MGDPTVPGHVPFWFKPVSAFGLLDLTTFISSSPGLAMPSTLAPDRVGVGSRWIPSRDIQPPEGEVTLSQELRTVGLLRPHVLVGFRWSYIGLCPGCKSSHNRLIRSFVSRLPQIRACPIKAPGSSCHLFATRRHTEWIAIAAGSGLCFRNRANRSHVIRRPRPRRDSQCCQSQVAPLRNRDNILELPVIP